MNPKRTNVIWKIPKEELEEVVKESSSFSQVFRKFNLSLQGSLYRAMKQRLNEEGIDFSHIPMGKDNNKGRKFPVKRIPLKEILVQNSTYPTVHLKDRLLKEGVMQNKCAICNQLPIWNGKPLVMRLDHINGVNNDHRVENLRLLCPNCDSQQDTFAGRNSRKNFCEKCGKHLPLKRFNKGKFCIDCCEKKGQRKVERPSKEILFQLILSKPFVQIAKDFGVSDNAVRKWCKSYGLPYKHKEIAELKREVENNESNLIYMPV